MNTIPAYRASVIDERRHRFNITTQAERRARRGRLIEAALTVALVAAVAACGFLSLSSPPNPGADPETSSRAGAPLTADNAPVRWQRKDFQPNPSPASVSQATTINRRGLRKSPAPVIGVKRKAAK